MSNGREEFVQWYTNGEFDIHHRDRFARIAWKDWCFAFGLGRQEGAKDMTRALELLTHALLTAESETDWTAISAFLKEHGK